MRIVTVLAVFTLGCSVPMSSLSRREQTVMKRERARAKRDMGLAAIGYGVVTAALGYIVADYGWHQAAREQPENDEQGIVPAFVGSLLVAFGVSSVAVGGISFGVGAHQLHRFDAELASEPNVVTRLRLQDSL